MGVRQEIKKPAKRRSFFVVPRTGLEPVCLTARDFKSLAYTIPPSGRDDVLSRLQFFHHVAPFELIPERPIVLAYANAANHGN